MKDHLYAVPAKTSYSINCGTGTLLIIHVSKSNIYCDSLFEGSCRDLGSLRLMARRKYVISRLPDTICLCCDDASGEIAQCKNLILESAMYFLKLVSNAVKTIPCPSQRSDCLNQKQLDIIEKHMIEHPEMDADVVSLAKLVSLSPGHFMRIYKNTTQTTVMERYRQIRIHAAEKMLASGNYNIADVVLALHFCNASQLTRHCQKYLHATPKQLLNRCAVSSHK